MYSGHRQIYNTSFRLSSPIVLSSNVYNVENAYEISYHAQRNILQANLNANLSHDARNPFILVRKNLAYCTETENRFRFLISGILGFLQLDYLLNVVYIIQCHYSPFAIFRMNRIFQIILWLNRENKCKINRLEKCDRNYLQFPNVWCQNLFPRDQKKSTFRFERKEAFLKTDLLQLSFVQSFTFRKILLSTSSSP